MATTPPRWPVLGRIEALPSIVENNIVDDVIFAVGRRDLDRMEDLFLALHERGIRTRFALRLFPHTQAKVELEELDGMPLLSFSPAPSSVLALAAKRMLDIALALLLLVVGLPIIVAIAVAIKLTSGGNVLYRQTRCGLNGRLFTLYKFRTMEEGAHEKRRELLALNEMTGPAFKLRRDPRVTWLGRFLRRFSLDELPQLWNVLRGEMSLVGPRPPIPEEVAQYQPLAAPPPGDEAGSHLPVADQRAQRHQRLRSVDAARPRVHRLVVADAGLQDPVEDDPGGAERSRRVVALGAFKLTDLANARPQSVRSLHRAS